MSLFTNLIKKTLTDFFQARKKWIIGVVVFIGLLIGLNYLVNHYVDKVVGTLIKEFVQDKSNGFYQAGFNEIGYILNEGRFFISEFQFDIHPDYQQNIVYEELKQNYIYKANIPKLHIDIIDFWSIFINRKLKVMGVEIGSPSIKILNLNKNKAPKKISFEAGNLYQVLSGHLKELKINNFLISKGEFDYKTYKGPDYDNFVVKGVTFEVKNFQVDEQASRRTDKFFYTDNISLEIENQILLLKDSLHKVTFDKFYISTLKNELGFKNFNLKRIDDNIVDENVHDLYNINLPELRLSGIDFLSAYNDSLLIIDSILIRQPKININKRSKVDKSTQTKNNLLDLAMVYNDYLAINHFNLDDAKLIFTDETLNQPKTYSIDHISANVANINIDSTRNSKHKYLIDFGKVEVIVRDFEERLPDGESTVKFGEFSITSNPNKIELKDFVIQPDSSIVNLNDETNFYANIPYIIISEFDIAMALNKDTFAIEELYIENPEIIVVQDESKKSKEQKTNFGGLFGLYAKLQSFSNLFVLDKISIINGGVKIKSSKDHRKNIELNHLSVLLENIVVDSLTNTKTDLFGNAEFKVSLDNSIVQFQPGKINIDKFEFASTQGKLKIDGLNFKLNSANSNNKIGFNFPEFVVTGIKPNEILFDNKINLDSVNFHEVEILVDLLDEAFKKNEKAKQQQFSLPSISINHLVGIDNDVNIKSENSPIFNANNIDFNISKFRIDQSISEKLINQFDYSIIHSISMDDYSFFLSEQNHQVEADNISWNNSNSTFSMENIKLIPYGKHKNRYEISIPKINMTGIDLKGVLKGSYYKGDEILIDHPVINLKLSEGKQSKMTNMDLGFIPLILRNKYLGAQANKFTILEAKINVIKKLEKDSLEFEADKISLLIDDFMIDSTTEMAADRFLFANDVKLKGDYLSVHQRAESNFYSVNHYYVSTGEGNIKLNGIYFATNIDNEFQDRSKIKFTTDNLNIQDFDFFKFTQNQILDISEVSIDDADFYLLPVDKSRGVSGSLNNGIFTDSSIVDNISTLLKSNDIFGDPQKKHKKNGSRSDVKSLLAEPFHIDGAVDNQLGPIDEKSSIANRRNVNNAAYPFDTLLLKSIEIDRFLITDSKVTVDNPEVNKAAIVIPDLWFLAEGIKYDPVSALDTNRIFYSDNLIAKITNFYFVLPDNLSSIRVDELTLNAKDSSILATNFALIPLVSRYDYGPAKGFQSTWLKIENNSISLDKVDFLSIVNNNSFNAQMLEVNKLDISVFRDKRIEFPEWQRRPLFQTNLRNLNFTLNIDTILVHDGFITYQEHSEKAKATGEVFFSDLNVAVYNLTNDSIRMLSNSKTQLTATTNAFGKGHLKGEFVFDLVNVDNIHTYGVEVDSFDLREFNRILIPSASVQISSGYSKKIIMTAKANENYSYGEMKFYYEDLKIALLNRETETPKGIGNALGSFFANTFIIKSNNPRNFFLRKGDIFFERDKKRAIFNYWSKTILSGVVSSIGATNNKKKIKKMQEKDLKRLREQESLAISNESKKP